MANDSNVDDLLTAQSALASTVREYITQLSYQLRTETDQGSWDKINTQLAKMVPLYTQLTGKNIAIIAARSKEDVANIMAVSKDVQTFIYGIKRIEKMITVATRIVQFVVVCMADTKDPGAIYKAGQGVYDAINDVIERETKKGANAAIDLVALSTLMVPTLLGGAVPAAKAKNAKSQKKVVLADAKKKT